MTPATLPARDARGPIAVPIGAGDRGRLVRYATEARRRATRGHHRQVLAAITVDGPQGLDVAAVVTCGRMPREPWTVYEQRERRGQALATLGTVVAIEASGPRRFRTVSDRWSQLTAHAITDLGTGQEAEGVVAVGGFAFADDGARSPVWEDFRSASLHVPLLSLATTAGRVRATVTVAIGPDDDPESRVDAALRRVAQLRPARPPLLDPDPVQRGRVASVLSPAHYEDAVARSVQAIRAGEMEKIVLAREVQVTGRPTPDPAAMIGVMREAYDGCCVVGVGRGDKSFVAATPELLLRRHGHRVATLALAGTTGRSSDPAVDVHLGEHLLRSPKNREEHAIVVRRILDRLDGVALWTTAGEQPEIVQAASVQHLATPIRAQLAEAVGVLELVERLHPTPAVGGFPEAATLAKIPALEGMDRGWYAGPVGWVDSAGDGDFSVALRSALLEPEVAHCYAGVGVVADSDPAAELAETEIKLQALLPLLAA